MVQDTEHTFVFSLSTQTTPLLSINSDLPCMEWELGRFQKTKWSCNWRRNLLLCCQRSSEVICPLWCRSPVFLKTLYFALQHDMSRFASFVCGSCRMCASSSLGASWSIASAIELIINKPSRLFDGSPEDPMLVLRMYCTVLECLDVMKCYRRGLEVVIIVFGC